MRTETGVGVAIGFLVFISLVTFLLWRRRKRLSRTEQPGRQVSESLSTELEDSMRVEMEDSVRVEMEDSGRVEMGDSMRAESGNLCHQNRETDYSTQGNFANQTLRWP